ncbi:MAG TPA: hypothetical protein PLX35_08510 [Cyclobacteriaceae bacterium]|nr:hypothetical protein [Cyclobacteriaceae bacterium]
MKGKFLLAVGLLMLWFVSAEAQRKLWGTASAGVSDNKGVIFSANDDGTGYTVKYNFVTDFPGVSPQSGLTLANGKFYGVTNSGGANDVGLLFEYDPINDTYTKKHDFDGTNGSYPYSAMVLANNGLLYGLTYQGGTNDYGVLYSYDPVNNIFTNLNSLSATLGGRPQGNLMQAANGKLYALMMVGGANAGGTLIEYTIAGNTLAKKVDLPAGAAPTGELIEASGLLFGMTYGGGSNGVGTLFEYDPVNVTFTVRANFDGAGSGSYPNGSLLKASNGLLYGMASLGGANGFGTLFEYNTGTTTLTKKIDFNSSNGALPQSKLYQATDTNLYGTTTNGGANNEGVLFRYVIGTNSLTVRANFNSADIGSNPASSLMQAVDGKLYSVAPYGGPTSNGTLFAYDPTNDAMSKRVDFSNSSNGSNPQAGMVQAPNGLFYGMTSLGGANAQGVLYEYDPALGTYTSKVDLSLAGTGGAPAGTLVLASNGNLYGMTSAGGANGDGVIFEYFPGSISVSVKVNFNAATIGSAPKGTLMQPASGSLLYGMTSAGGPSSHGTLFAFDPGTGSLTVKYTFTATSEGTSPQGSLVQAANGKLYGTTSAGGAGTSGVLFEYDINTDTYAKKVDFTGSNGANPYGDIVQATDGKLYGMTNGGGANSNGIIYQYDPYVTTSNYAVKFSFNGAASGSAPYGALVESSPGKLYGTTSSGGAQSSGTFFQYDIAGTFTKIKDLGGADGASPLYGSLLLNPPKQTQTVTFGPLSQKAPTDPPFSVSPTASSSLTVKLTSSNTAVATVSGNTITIVGLGTTVISASQWGNTTYAYAQDIRQNLVVAKASQTITFNTLATKTYGDAPFNLGATASSGLTVTYASSDPTIASVSGTTVTILKAGSVTITASQAGDVNYNAAPDVPQTLTINKKAQSIGFTIPGVYTYGDGAFLLNGNTDSGLPVTYTDLSATPLVTFSGVYPNISATIVQAGSTTIRASQAGNGNYLAAPNTDATLTVNKKTQTITFNPLPNATYGDAPITLTATSSSGLPISYTSSVSSVATTSVNILTIAGAGSTLITAIQSGNVNYLPATNVGQNLTVNKANQTITFSALPSKALTDPPFALGATASSGLPVSYVSSDLTIATISGSTVTLQNKSGFSNITASQAGNANFNAATPVIQQLTVVPKTSQTITFNALPAKIVGDASFNLTATATSGLAVTYTSGDPTVASISGSTVTILKAGTVTITASQGGDPTYAAAPDVQQTLTIGKGNQTITFGTLATVANTDPPFTLTATSSVGLPVTFSSSNTSLATISGNTVTLGGSAGTVTITASQAGNSDYNAASPVQQTLTIIARSAQTITFGVLQAKAMGDAAFSLSASTTSGLPITFTSSNTAVATISGVTVTIVGAGSTDITASQPGNTSFLPATPVTQPLVVQKGNQQISFSPPASPVLGGPTFTLAAISTSGLPVTFTPVTTTKLSISGNVGTTLLAGLATVRASQAGNANYNAAVPVDQTFCIKPTIPTITVTNGNTNSPILTSSAVSNNVWLLNGSPITGGTNQAYTVIKAGTYTVITSVDNCFSDASAPQTFVITGDLPLDNNASLVYPNPSTDKVYVDLRQFAQHAVEVRMSDMTGRTVHQLTAIGGGVAEINITENQPAMYLIEAVQGDYRTRARFVKN